MRCEALWAMLLAWVAWAVAMLALQGCAGGRATVEGVSAHDTVYRYRYASDSVWIKDSLSVVLDLRRDTVVRTVERWRTLWRERVAVDTCYVSRADTVRVVERVEAERPLTWWERFRLRWFGVLAAVALGLAAWVLRKPVAAVARSMLTRN